MSRTWHSQLVTLKLEKRLSKFRMKINNDLSVIIHFYPYGIPEKSMKGYTASDTAIDLKGHHKKYMDDYLIIQWMVGNAAQLQMFSIKHYIKQDPNVYIGFHSLFKRDFISQQKSQIKITIEHVPVDIFMQPSFDPKRIGNEKFKLFMNTKYCKFPQNTNYIGHTTQIHTQSQEHNYTTISPKADNSKKSEVNANTINALTPVSKYLLNDKSQKICHMIDRGMIRQKIQKMRAPIMKTKEKQLTLQDCLNFPLQREKVTKVKIPMKLISKLIDVVRHCHFKRYLPTIDCFPDSNYRKMSLCKEYISGNMGFFNEVFNDIHYWSKRVAWMHVNTLSDMKRLLKIIPLRQICGYCCFSVWLSHKQEWYDVKRNFFLKAYVRKCDLFYVLNNVKKLSDGQHLDILFLCYLNK